MFVKILLSGLIALSCPPGAIVVRGQALPSVTFSEYATTTTFSLTLWKDVPILPDISAIIATQNIGIACSHAQDVWFWYSGSNYSNEFQGLAAGSCGFIFPRSNIRSSSVRRIGPILDSNNQPRLPSMHLFEKVGMSGSIDAYTAAQPNNLTNFESLVFLGNERVQFYLREEYQGFSKCVEPGGSNRKLIRNVQAIGAEPGDIKSFKFGCSLADNYIRASDKLLINEMQLRLGKQL